HTRWPRDWSSVVCSSDLHSKALARLASGSITIPRLGPGGGFFDSHRSACVLCVALCVGDLAEAGAVRVHGENLDASWIGAERVRSEERRVGKEWRAEGER